MNLSAGHPVTDPGKLACRLALRERGEGQLKAAHAAVLGARVALPVDQSPGTTRDARSGMILFLGRVIDPRP